MLMKTSGDCEPSGLVPDFYSIQRNHSRCSCRFRYSVYFINGWYNIVVICLGEIVEYSIQWKKRRCFGHSTKSSIFFLYAVLSIPPVLSTQYTSTVDTSTVRVPVTCQQYLYFLYEDVIGYSYSSILLLLSLFSISVKFDYNGI